MKQKTLYESPSLHETSLELEQVLCASVTMQSNEIGLLGLDEIDKSDDWVLGL